MFGAIRNNREGGSESIAPAIGRSNVTVTMLDGEAVVGVCDRTRSESCARLECIGAPAAAIHAATSSRGRIGNCTSAKREHVVECITTLAQWCNHGDARRRHASTEDASLALFSALLARQRIADWGGAHRR